MALCLYIIVQLSDGNTPLPKLMFTYHPKCSVTFTREKFPKMYACTSMLSPLKWCQLKALQASPVVHLVTPLSCVSFSTNTQPSVPAINSHGWTTELIHWAPSRDSSLEMGPDNLTKSYGTAQIASSCGQSGADREPT